MRNNNIRKMIFAALCLALAYVLPFLTMQIPQFGNMLCPMHVPVLLCGFLCGWPWGVVIGFAAPLLRSLTLGAPPIFPMGICMAFELATYGGTAGLLYTKLPKKKINVYSSLLISMIAGRLVWGVARLVCAGLDVSKFGLSAFWSGAIVTAIPGIIVQIVLIPIIVMLLERFDLTNQKR